MILTDLLATVVILLLFAAVTVIGAAESTAQATRRLGVGYPEFSKNSTCTFLTRCSLLVVYIQF